MATELVRYMRDPSRSSNWTYIYEGLVWLRDFLTTRMKCERMVEVGSFAGESAEVFAKAFGEVHCVDTWKEDATEFSPKVVEESFDERMRASEGRMFKWKMTSREASALWPDESMDMVYIDADHSYESVKEDIGLWWPKVRKGGFLGGHDIVLPGVNKALLDVFGNQLPSVVFPDFSWLIPKR